MGAPRNEVERFSVKIQTDLLTTALQTAMHFRSHEQREQGLELLRQSLFPFVDWLDKPIKECFRGYDDSTFRHGLKRAMPVFEWSGDTLSVVALDRRGRWITMGSVPVSEPKLHRTKELSSAALAMKIEENRFNILGFLAERKHLQTAEGLGLGPIISHCAFQQYVRKGIATVGNMIEEREDRLRVMRANHDVLMSFTAGLDPLAFNPKLLLGFSVFNEHERGTSRCSGTYFAREPVALEVDRRNAERKPDSKLRYYIFDESHSLHELPLFLRKVCWSLEEIKDTPSSMAREPLSEAEAQAIQTIVDSIGSS